LSPMIGSARRAEPHETTVVAANAAASIVSA
jgi:hypothetical protein